MKDFWLSCGHHLLDRDRDGRLQVTDEFMKLYLARPELVPPPDAGMVERSLQAKLLSDPWRPVVAAEIDAIMEADARENWHYLIALRHLLAAHGTIEASYESLVRKNIRLPPIFVDQLTQLILRNALDQCEDAYVLRAGELFFRPQRLTVYNEALLAADQEYVDASGGASPLAAMLGLSAQIDIDVLADANAAGYWERSDRFDLALDLTTGHRGLAALGTVISSWVKHLLHIDVVIEPLDALRDVRLAWYVGLDGYGTKIGDALWNGAEIDEATRNRIVGLFRMTFRDPEVVIERMVEEPVYLILAMTPDCVMRMKPQNLLNGLPLRQLECVT